MNNNPNSDSRSTLLVQKDVAKPVSGRHVFAFDSVFGEQATTQAVYQQIAQPVVQAVAAGQHGTVLAYGPTGSGKTYTMQGSSSSSGSGDSAEQQHAGVVQLAVADLLRQCPESVLEAQFFEVYNEQVRDLLLDDEKDSTTPKRSNALARTTSGMIRRKEEDDPSFLTLRYNEADGTASVPARSHCIQTVDDVVNLLQRGNRRRTSAATALNAQSSRSHAIFRLQLQTTRRRDNNGATTVVQQSVLNLVDLAGSENSKQAGISGMQKRETGKINQR